MKKRNKEIAKKIVKLEKQIISGKSEKEIMSEIEKIMNTLSLEDMFEIDEYIITKKFLTK